MAPTKQRRRGHDRGGVLVDVAVMLADGGDTISDVAVLRDQPDLFGEVASHPTVWRTLEAVDEAALERIKTARAEPRAKAWAAGADPGFYVIDIDATLVGSHSEKEHAAPTYKRGFGFHPLLAYLDATGEALAGVLRPGNAGSGTAADHVAVLDDALAQLPIDPASVEVIVQSRLGGLVTRLRGALPEPARCSFVIGHQLTVDIAKVLVDIPKRAWSPAITADGSEWRDHAEVVEITDLVSDVFDSTRRWPSGLRMIARRELPHPGAQLTFTDIDGHRYQVFVTDLADPDIAYLEALYRGRGRAERQICDTKATGLTNLPSHSFAINTAWLQLTLIAHDLLAWTRLLVLDGRPRHGRTETAPLLPVPHRRPDRHHRPTALLSTLQHLALDPRPRRRVHPPRHHPPPGLNDTPRFTGDRTTPDRNRPTRHRHDTDLARPHHRHHHTPPHQRPHQRHKPSHLPNSLG